MAGTLAAGLVPAVDARAPVTRSLSRLRVARTGDHFEDAAGRPFFWLADTAWDLAWRTTRTEALLYLDRRAAQGFTVIQIVALAESSDLRTPTDTGLLPLNDRDPARPDARFFDHLGWLIDAAAQRGLYVALLPTWGDKVTAPWGTGPRLFRADNLPVVKEYGRFLGARFGGRTNIVWMLGGDRPARLAPGPPGWWARGAARTAGWADATDWRPVWRAMAAGLIDGARTNGGAAPLIGYHPQGGPESTFVMLPGEPWLAFNGVQSGHGGGRDSPGWNWIARDRAADPTRPVIDLEINYEDHPVDPWPVWNPANGYFRDGDVRAQAYRTVFAGAAGVSYGHHAVWQFAGPRHPGINHVDRDWIAALDRPGARQLIHLRRLLSGRLAARTPATALIRDNGSGAMHAAATRGPSWLLVYLPSARTGVTIDLAAAGLAPPRARWFDPRTGARRVARAEGDGVFRRPAAGDWVLELTGAGDRRRSGR